MKKWLLLLTIIPLLTSCGAFRVHKMDIEQGNILSDAKLNQVHLGMDEAQVRTILGNPLLVTLFDRDELAYVYTYQAAYQPAQITKVRYIFQNGKLAEIQRT